MWLNQVLPDPGAESKKKPGINSFRPEQQRQMKTGLIDISKPVIKDLVNIHNLICKAFRDACE